MTKTEPTTEFLLTKEELVQFVGDRLDLAESDSILTMTIRRWPSGEFFVSAVTRPLEPTLR